MAFLIDKDEATAARRRVPFKLFVSNGTDPDTGASGDSLMYSVNGAEQSDLTVSVISANAGMYYGEFAQADLATLGTIAMWHDVGSFIQHVANVNVVNFNPMSTQSDLLLTDLSIGTVSHLDNQSVGTVDNDLPSSATIAGVTNTLTVVNALNNIDGSGVTLHAGTHSDATIQGLSNYANISDVTLHAGTHSDVTIQGIENDSVMTIAGVVNSATLINALNNIDGSAVTIHTGGITAASFAVDAINAAALATDAVNEIRDAVLNIVEGTTTSTSVGGQIIDTGRTESVTDYWQHAVVEMTSGSNIGQMRRVTEFDTATDTITVSPVFKSSIALGVTYRIVRVLADGLRPTTEGNETVDVTSTGAVGIDWANIEAPTTEVDLSATTMRGIDLLNTVNPGGITSASFGVGAIDAAALASDAVDEVSDGFLDRDMATGTDSGTSAIRTARDALRSLRNRVESDTTQIYVYEENDTTIKWTASISTTVSTDPHITGADPNS